MNAFFIALQLLTRLPCPHHLDMDDNALGQSVLYYPFIGLLLGVILAVADALLVFLPASITAALLLIISVLLNGALHLDGLADSADAWLANGDKATSLRIMKDPHIGAAGVVSVVLLLLLKYAVLVELVGKGYYWLILLTPLLARTIPLISMLILPYASPHGIAQKQHDNIPIKPAWIIIIGVTSVAAMFNLIAFCLMLAVLYGLYVQSKNKLKGYSGDVLGASIEVTEVMYMLGFCISVYL